MLARDRCLLRALGRGFAALFLFALGGGCSGSDSGPDFGTNAPELVVAVGDSITFGYGDVAVDTCSESYRTAGGFCPRLAALSGMTVINEGDCGETAASGAARVQSVLARWNPGILLIDYGVNDMFHGSAEVIADLRTMIGAAVSNKTIPIVATLAPAAGDHRGWEPFIEHVNEDIREMCKELDVVCADHYKAFMDDPGFAISPFALLSADGLHPNASGYDLMAKTWQSALDRVR